MTSRHATTIRFTAAQAGWMRQRAFDLNVPQQLIIEDALIALGMPKGDAARTGDLVTSQPFPLGVKDYYDRDGNLWTRGHAAGWCRHVITDGVDTVDRFGVPLAEVLREYGPLKVGKLKGQ